MPSSIRFRSFLAGMLAAAALAAVAAQPAAADNPSAQFYGSTTSTQTTRWCETPWVGGVYGAYGAWGYYVDGCTASVMCPWSRCTTMSAQGIVRSAGVYTTCNAAVRVFTSYGSLRWRTDLSRADRYGYCATNLGAPQTSYGEWVTVQTNGVIASGTGSVKSYIWLAPA
jgi:hypothetical protein